MIEIAVIQTCCCCCCW